MYQNQRLMVVKKVVTIITTLMLALCVPTLSQAQQITADFSLLPPGTNISLIAQYTDGDHEQLFSHQSQQLRIPASTQKIVTALAALLELGHDFHFITTFESDASLNKNTLNGNLILKMSADPTFTRQQLSNMVNSLKQQGIEQITGNIIIDSSIFAGHDKAAGWSWNNLTYCYNTSPAASIIDGNCFYASVSPAAKVGQIASVSASSIYPVTLSSDIITTSKDSDNQYCELDITAKDNNNYQFSGCVRVTDKKRYFQFAVSDGGHYIAQILREMLSKQGIIFKGNITESKQSLGNSKMKILASNQSEALPVLLTNMLKRSNNLIADTVFRTIGAHYFHQSGTWRNGSDAVREILKEKANIDLKNNVIIDGSGLSRLNLLNAKTMLEILEYVADHDSELNMINMLPIAGVDGTLQYRNSLRHMPFKQTVFAKTGYLEGSYNLAGFIKTHDNRYIAFVQFLTGYRSDDSSKPEKTAIMKFEETFYAQCLNSTAAN
ncbi:serine-type D-Ala-D-Ala carboxypeptidase [Utexia brackfieldae]|uniref:serine-type D-Ala-D-Ala carboxypeptidase n=1 Tax=Utexia brackfieldae TaxID=3074108 RepID=UPI00370D6596